MKILILNWRDNKHPLAGGAEISLLEHAKYWYKKGAEITWFSSGNSDLPEKEFIDGITYLRKGSHYTVHLWAYWYVKKRLLGNPDIIIDSFHFLPYFSSFYLEKKKIIALINEVAGEVWFDNLSYPAAWVGNKLEPLFFTFYKNIPFITASESARKDLIKVGIKPQQITIVPHGFRTVSTSVQKSSIPTLLFLARISNDKGIRDALIAFSLAKKKLPRLQLWIAGKEERPGLLDTLIKQHIVTQDRSSIHNFGFVTEKKKAELLRRANILIHPSKKEGWGLTVIEAASFGTPTIGYNVAGLRDSVQNGKTGLLVKAQKIDLLSDAIVRSFTDSNLSSQLQKNAIQWSKHFSWDESVMKSWKLIQHVYEKNKKSK